MIFESDCVRHLLHLRRVNTLADLIPWLDVKVLDAALGTDSGDSPH